MGGGRVYANKSASRNVTQTLREISGLVHVCRSPERTGGGLAIIFRAIGDFLGPSLLQSSVSLFFHKCMCGYTIARLKTFNYWTDVSLDSLQMVGAFRVRAGFPGS